MHIIAKIIIALALFIAAVMGIPAYLSIDDLRDCSMPSLSKSCEAADAIVAISGGDTTARTLEAIRLYKEGWGSKLIFSGAALDKSGPSNASAMQKLALTAGVPQTAIVIDEIAGTTEENAISVGQIIRLHQMKRVVLVTSPYHQRRAFIEFKQAAPKDVVLLNHPTQNDRLWPQTWWLSPSRWLLALTELGKTLFVQTWSSIWPTSM